MTSRARSAVGSGHGNRTTLLQNLARCADCERPLVRAGGVYVCVDSLIRGSRCSGRCTDTVMLERLIVAAAIGVLSAPPPTSAPPTSTTPASASRSSGSLAATRAISTRPHAGMRRQWARLSVSVQNAILLRLMDCVWVRPVDDGEDVDWDPTRVRIIWAKG